MLVVQLVDGSALLSAVAVTLLPRCARSAVAEMYARGLSTETLAEVGDSAMMSWQRWVTQR